MLRFAQHTPYRIVACEVVGRGDVTGWWQTVHLNKGTADGVWTNMAVITADGGWRRGAVVPLNLKRGLNQAPDKLIVSLRVD